MTRIDEIKARLEKATPGPWAWAHIGEKVNGYVIGNAVNGKGEDLSGHVEFFDYDEESGDIVETHLTFHEVVGDHEASTCNYADATFIAHAPDDIAWLIEQLEAKG